MWEIKLIDIGGDGLVTEKQTSVDTLLDCEVMAALLCARHLGVVSVNLVYDDNLMYSVRVNGVEVGVVHIRTL